MTQDAAPGTDDEVARAVAVLLDENSRARAELLDAIEGLSDDRRCERWFDDWSIYEIIAHLAAWQDGFATALEGAVRGERPQVPGFDPLLEDATDRYNANVAESVPGTTWEQMMVRLDAARAHHEAAVRSVPDRIPADRFEEGRSTRRLASSANHDREHTPEILEWRAREGI